jgi:hypothetical protein
MPLLYSGLTAFFLGALSARFLFIGSWLSLIPWVIAGLLCGTWASNKKQALKNGATYGFVLPVAFMLTGYNGAYSLQKLLPLFILSLILGVIGIGCGLVLAWIGTIIRKGYNKTNV